MRRSRIDIIIDIMDGAKTGVHKTAIVYRANLNFEMAGKYLELLQKHELMENRIFMTIISSFSPFSESISPK